MEQRDFLEDLLVEVQTEEKQSKDEDSSSESQGEKPTKLHFFAAV